MSVLAAILRSSENLITHLNCVSAWMATSMMEPMLFVRIACTIVKPVMDPETAFPAILH